MITFNQIGEVNPHSGNMEYSVEFDKEYSVKSFADMLLNERKEEWGNVSLVIDPERPNRFDNPSFWYRNGRLDNPGRFEEIIASYGSKKISKATAFGGHYRFDYMVWMSEESVGEPVTESIIEPATEFVVEEAPKQDDISEESETVESTASAQRSKHRRNRNRNRNRNKDLNEENRKENE